MKKESQGKRQNFFRSGHWWHAVSILKLSLFQWLSVITITKSTLLIPACHSVSGTLSCFWWRSIPQVCSLGVWAAAGHSLPLPNISFLPSIPVFHLLPASLLYLAQLAHLRCREQVLFPCRGPHLKEMLGMKLALRWLGNRVSFLNLHTQTLLHTAKSV